MKHLSIDIKEGLHEYKDTTIDSDIYIYIYIHIYTYIYRYIYTHKEHTEIQNILTSLNEFKSKPTINTNRTPHAIEYLLH